MRKAEEKNTKMKVRKTSHASLSFSCRTCVQLCYISNCTILLIYMMSVFYAHSLYVNALTNDIDYGPQSHKIHGKSYALVGKNVTDARRAGRFLFDTLFDISPPAITVDDEFDEGDDDDEDGGNACRCGE